jgi:hypothetical protein
MTVPTYVYQAKAKGCSLCAQGFEYKQSIKDDPLESCPECGVTVGRIICAPFVQTGPTDKSVLSDSNLQKHGFQKLINEGDGKFRKSW